MAADISTYNRILSLNRIDTTNFTSNSIPTFVPSPTEDDYNVGYIQRYFIQSRNDENGYIYEVENYYYADILTNPFFNGVVLRWKISGDMDEVRIMNQKSVNYTSKDMKSLSLYLPNYLQFYKLNSSVGSGDVSNGESYSANGSGGGSAGVSVGGSGGGAGGY